MPIKMFVGLKSKRDNQECLRAKTVYKNVVQGVLKFEDYKNVLFHRT